MLVVSKMNHLCQQKSSSLFQDQYFTEFLHQFIYNSFIPVHQMRIVMKGFVFALDMDKAIDSITAACSQCSALKKVLHFATQQIQFWSTWDHWQHICCWRYEARNTAHIYYAVTLFLLQYCPNYWGRESRDTPSRNHPILYRAKTRDGTFAVVRTDPSPGFQALANDLILKFHRISIELGRLKNGKKPCHRTCSPRRREHIPRIDPIARAVFSLLLSLGVATVTVRFNKGVCLQGRC